jgi:predicted transposase/invertase (TIGR01784 family)
MSSYAQGLYERFRDEERKIGRAEGIEIGKAEGIEIGRAIGIEIGKRQVIEQEKLSMASKLYQHGLPLSLIAEATDLSIETIANQLNQNS